MFLPSILRETPAQRQERQERKKARIAAAVPYDPAMRWERELNLQAASYQAHVLELFPRVASSFPHAVNDLAPAQFVDSPCGAWRYCVKELPTGARLDTYNGRKKGDVLFDGSVRLPALHDRERYHREGEAPRWNMLPWMSLTPMEVFSLRPGTRRAKGAVIVAGLGLGHQLIEVSKRKKVTSLTLVERERSLVDWLLPILRPHLGCEIDVIVGDAYEVLPKMQADVCLLDIFRGYGGNKDDADRVRETSPGIGFVWAWGSQYVEGSASLWG